MPPSRQQEALAADLERIAVGAVDLTTRALAHGAADIELTFPQWRALLVLGESDEGLRISEVAARVGVTLPATSRLLRRLERRQLTSLAIDAQDRRATRARLTERGRRVRAAIIDYRSAALREVAAGVGDPRRLTLAAGLRVLADRLEEPA